MPAMILFGAIAIVACATDADAPSAPTLANDVVFVDAEAPNETFDAGTPGADSTDLSDAGDTSSDAGDPDAAAQPVRTDFRIHFDYRFDTSGFFSSPSRKVALEAAAAVWNERLHDRFETVPKGTIVTTLDPEHYQDPVKQVTIESDIEGLLIFVGSTNFSDNALARAAPTGGSSLSKVTDPALAARLTARNSGPDFEPWTGFITFKRSENWYFDTTPTAIDIIPSGRQDFVSVALHEIGHALGFGTAKAWQAFVSNGYFTGPNAVATYGRNVPLSPDRAHLAANVKYGGLGVLMDPSSAKGERRFPTPLELAILKDIGYEP